MLKIALLVGVPSAVTLSSVFSSLLPDSDFIFMISVMALLVAIIPRLDDKT